MVDEGEEVGEEDKGLATELLCLQAVNQSD